MTDPTTEAIDSQAERLREHQEKPSVMENHAEKMALEAYRSSTIALRDAELALKAAQEGYRRALEALNKAIAPFPEKP